MLPTSRNTNYTAASPVKSADLNDLQDGFVGAKHPLLQDPYDASDFTPETPANAALTTGDWVSSGALVFVCGLNYPVGTRLVEIDFTYRVGVNGGAGVTCSLNRKLLAAPMTGTTVATTAADHTDVSPGETTALVCNHTVQAGYRYFMEIVVASTGSTVYGAVVQRDRL